MTDLGGSARTLAEWLAWQETIHPAAIALGLERVTEVARRLGVGLRGKTVITVAGTNGKGSSVAMLVSIYRAAGYRVGAYTSPHLWRYNERVCVDGKPVRDADLCAAFEQVKSARGQTPLTYFEFGTLAALCIFDRLPLNLVVLEVGLGGRLDAVNAIDPDAALITSIALDHQQWLGTDREQIGREKAGILRAGGVAVCSDPRPPTSILATAAALGVDLQCVGRQIEATMDRSGWTWRRGDRGLRLPRPGLRGAFQIDNAAGVVAVIEGLSHKLPVTELAMAEGIRTTTLPGRLQSLGNDPTWVFDVAHNQAAAGAIWQELRQRYPCPIHVLLGVLADKDIGAIARSFSGAASWHIAPPACERAAPLDRMLVAVGKNIGQATPQAYACIEEAVHRIDQLAGPDEVVLVTGSFYTVAQAQDVFSRLPRRQALVESATGI